MSPNDRHLYLAHGDLPWWQACFTRLEMMVSRRSREKYQRHVAIANLLRRSLADPEDVVSIDLERTKRAKTAMRWWLLLALCLIATYEWQNYTLPAIYSLVRNTAERCGL